MSETKDMQKNLNDACDALDGCGFDMTGKTVAQCIELMKLMHKDLALQVVDRGNSFKKQQAEIQRLTTENANLKTQLSGRTYYHDNARVEAENERLAQANETLSNAINDITPHVEALAKQILEGEKEINQLTSALQSAQKETAREICQELELQWRGLLPDNLIAAIKSRYGVE
jgi:DNA repair exonuclease SbcCD ATPase subunit